LQLELPRWLLPSNYWRNELFNLPKRILREHRGNIMPHSQFFLPMALGRMVFSTRLLSIWTRPSEEHEEFVPLAKGIADGFAGAALGQVFAPGKKVVEPEFDV
jgi:hypothetical protein